MKENGECRDQVVMWEKFEQNVSDKCYDLISNSGALFKASEGRKRVSRADVGRSAYPKNHVGARP